MSEEKLAIHKRKVEAISEMVRNAYDNAKPGEYFSLKKASVSHMAPQPDNPVYSDKPIDVRSLTDIIEINTDTRTCIAEAGVTFVRLARETLKYGLVPQCVSELKEITIGGVVAGCSVESMSFKYGGFFDSCEEIEIVTGTGDIMLCTKSDNHEIFEMLHGSFGTIAIITLLKFRLVPAKECVRIDYIRYDTFSEYMEAIKQHYEKQDIEMMDGLIFSENMNVLCVASFVDEEEAPYKSKYFYDIYYKSAMKRKRDFLFTIDYFFRYDADCHWSIRNVAGGIFENKVVRWLVGPFILGSTNILKISERLPFLTKKGGEPDVIIDVFIPITHAEEFFNWYLELFDYFPVWIVPYRMQKNKLDGYKFYPWLNQDMVAPIEDELFIDFAIYGFEQKRKGFNFYKALEEKVHELRGMKTLITHNFYEEDLFWKVYNKKFYDKVKERTDPKNLFRNLYEKTNYKKKTEKTKRLKVGIPRSLYFYKYFPLWEGMLTSLGCEVIVSPETNKEILTNGSNQSATDLCIPVKIHYGHVNYLSRNHPDLDFIFVPRLISKSNDHYYCPKFLILPDVTRHSAVSNIPVIEWIFNAREHSMMKSAIDFGKTLDKSKEESKLAYENGYKKLEEFHELIEDGILVPDALYKMYPFEKYPNYKFKKRFRPKLNKDYENYPLSLMVLGHPYNTYESIINHGLMDILKSNFVDVVTVENAPKEIFSRRVEIDDNLCNFWDNEDELMQLSDYVIHNEEIDGGIFLISFACGPDSLIQELVMQDFDMKDKPFINLTLDEHTGESQITTRVESFIEMIRRKKYN